MIVDQIPHAAISKISVFCRLGLFLTVRHGIGLLGHSLDFKWLAQIRPDGETKR